MSGGSSPLVLESVTQQFVDRLAPSPAIFLPVESRAALVRAQAIPAGRPRASTQDLTFPVGTGSVGVRIVRPLHATEALPIAMLFHGGRSMLGDRDTHDRFCRELAVDAEAAVIFVDYDRVDQSRFPAAIEQAYDATRYAVEHAAALKLDASRLALVGDSVGGNIAAAVALLAKERRGPKIDLQVLLYPVTDADFTTGSYQRFSESPWLTRAAMMWFWDTYLPDHARRTEITATPLNATIEELRNLPEALVIVAEGDVLCDEGEAYARKLSDAGVRVTSVRYNGTIHDFMLLHALADTPAARGGLAQVVAALRSAFG